MIDVERDQLITMAEVSAMLPNRPSLCAIWRWRTKGVRGKKLETVVIGGKPFTTRAAVARFAEYQGGSDAPQSRTPAQRQRAAEKASRELEAAGW
jgi:hypothetical protein